MRKRDNRNRLVPARGNHGRDLLPPMSGRSRQGQLGDEVGLIGHLIDDSLPAPADLFAKAKGAAKRRLCGSRLCHVCPPTLRAKTSVLSSSVRSVTALLSR